MGRESLNLVSFLPRIVFLLILVKKQIAQFNYIICCKRCRTFVLREDEGNINSKTTAILFLERHEIVMRNCNDLFLRCVPSCLKISDMLLLFMVSVGLLWRVQFDPLEACMNFK